MTLTKVQPTNTPTSSRVTISMRATQHADQCYAVEMMVTGLISENEAIDVLGNLQNLICGSEIATN